jgi:hypothetical protein
MSAAGGAKLNRRPGSGEGWGISQQAWCRNPYLSGDVSVRSPCASNSASQLQEKELGSGRPPSR